MKSKAFEKNSMAFTGSDDSGSDSESTPDTKLPLTKAPNLSDTRVTSNTAIVSITGVTHGADHATMPINVSNNGSVSNIPMIPQNAFMEDLPNSASW